MLWFFSHIAFAQTEKVIHVEIGVYVGAYNKYPQFMHQDVCLSPPDFKYQQTDRTLGEIIILCEAISATGYQLKPHFHSLPNNFRGLLLLEKGLLDALSSSLWPFEFKNSDVNVTEAAVLKGEFEKGLYVSNKNTKLLNQSLNKSDIKKLTGITISKWRHDVELMKTLTPKVVEIEHHLATFKLLDTQRGDFVLSEFSNQETFQICQQTICITALQGLKVVIEDTRHFVASKSTQNGKQYFQLLSSGMAKLKEKGRIRQLYEQMGFINPKVKDWKRLN